MKSLITVVGRQVGLQTTIPLEISVKTFSAGEVQVTLEAANTCDSFNVTAKLKDSSGIIALLQVLSILKSISEDIVLHLPYVSFARQDRAMVSGDAQSLKLFAGLLNSFNLPKVVITDPHSDVAPALINNSYVINQHECIKTFDFGKKFDAVISPDAGAYKKCLNVSKALGVNNLIVALKDRNVTTGEITGTRVTDSVAGLDVLIADDICDGGWTFIQLAKALKEAGAKTVTLYITHGIFSKGLEPLLVDIDMVYAYYNWHGMVNTLFVKTANDF